MLHIVGLTEARLRTQGDELSKFHVSQIETHVRGLYEGTEWDTSLAEVNNLSRVLALHAVHLVFGELAEGSQIVEITDGEADWVLGRCSA